MRRLQNLTRSINLKGELFSSTFTYGLTAMIRLVSSLILTRILDPKAYGIFGILFSFQFIIELISDIGSIGLLIRHPRGKDVQFVHSVWTVRLIRCVFNFFLVLLGAPLIAKAYGAPILTNAFRLMSFWFLISGLESMSFILTQRDQRARISNYVDLASNALMSVFVIVTAIILKSFYALILGALLQRALTTIASHFFYRDIGVGIAFDREALRDHLKFARFVWPSSVLTILLSQYDKVVLLRLFNFNLLGVYVIAGNMMGPISGVILHNARVILYARCANYFRENRLTAASRYYRENVRLLVLGVTIPSLIAGFAPAIVFTLYDSRYAMAGPILRIFALGAIAYAMQNASENLLVASGRTRAVLEGNAVRLAYIVPATIFGYHFFGFYGFVWLYGLSHVVPLAFFYYVQKKAALLRPKRELRLLAIALGVFLLSFSINHWLMKWITPGWLRLLIKHH